MKKKIVSGALDGEHFVLEYKNFKNEINSIKVIKKRSFSYLTFTPEIGFGAL